MNTEVDYRDEETEETEFNFEELSKESFYPQKGEPVELEEKWGTIPVEGIRVSQRDQGKSNFPQQYKSATPVGSAQSRFVVLESKQNIPYPHSIKIHPKRREKIEETFYKLLEEWREETLMLSSLEEMIMHPSYQMIIGLGKRAVPLLLKELKKEPDHLFWALHVITRKDPTSEEDAGDLQKMASSWIKWGEKKGYL